MLKKLSLRCRSTLLSALLLTLCCAGLTIMLNFSAFQLVDQIEAAAVIKPATEIPLTQELEATPTVSAEHLNTSKRAFSLQSMLYMLFIIGGGSALTYFIAGKALKPLDDLNEQVKNITVHNLSKKLEIPPTKDEIAELTQSFNTMSSKLNDAFMTQKRFSASAAHELRTPLSVLQTKIDVFKKRNTHTSDEYDALIAVFEKQITRLRRLVINLLDMTNMDRTQEKSTIHLRDLFEDILCELSLIAKNNAITLSLNSDDSTVTGNIDLLYRAFYNLIENGINYNTQGGFVQVTVTKTAVDYAQIQIKDSGIGIPDTMKKHIFEPFYRVDPSRSRELGGAGLGLSITHSIIENHGGNITVSDHKNGGTCFSILLPTSN